MSEHPVTDDQAVPLPPDLRSLVELTISRSRVLSLQVKRSTAPQVLAGEIEQALAALLAEVRAEGAAAERERIRKAILARAIQCRTCGKPHLGYLQPGVDGHPYEARFASPSSSLLERLADLLDGATDE